MNDADVTLKIADTSSRALLFALKARAGNCSETNLLIKNNIIRGVIKRASSGNSASSFCQSSLNAEENPKAYASRINCDCESFGREVTNDAR